MSVFVKYFVNLYWSHTCSNCPSSLLLCCIAMFVCFFYCHRLSVSGQAWKHQQTCSVISVHVHTLDRAIHTKKGTLNEIMHRKSSGRKICWCTFCLSFPCRWISVISSCSSLLHHFHSPCCQIPFHSQIMTSLNLSNDVSTHIPWGN